jgi:hypothetical protein
VQVPRERISTKYVGPAPAHAPVRAVAAGQEPFVPSPPAELAVRLALGGFASRGLRDSRRPVCTDQFLAELMEARRSGRTTSPPSQRR